MGEIIESLKINHVPTNTDLAEKGVFGQADKGNFEKDGPLNKAYQRSLLAGILYEMYITLKDVGNIETKKSNSSTLPGYNFYCYAFKVEGEVPPPNTKGGKQPESFVNEPKNIYIKLKDFIALLNKYILLSDGTNPIVELSLTEGFQHTEDTTNEPKELLCLGHPYQISMDPTICLIKNLEFSTAIKATAAAAEGDTEAAVEAGNTANEVIEGIPKSDNFLTELKDNGYYGKIGNIYVNLAYLYTLITDDGLSSQDKNEKKDINLFDFIKNMMSGINNSIGSNSNFDIHVDPTDSIARIIDVNYVDEKTKANAYKEAFELQMHNLKSTVRSYKLESQIFPEQSSVVAIGAQAKGGALGSGDNTLIDFNKNLTDRIVKKKELPPAIPTPESDTQLTNLKTNLTTIAEYFSSLDDGNAVTRFFRMARAEFDKAKASQYTNALKDTISYTKVLTTDKNNNTAIIPTKLSIEMDGIGGIIIGSMFKIPPDILPRGYTGIGGAGALVGYLVTSVAHSIGSDNDWKTTLGAQFIILDGGQVVENKSIKSISAAIATKAREVARVKIIPQNTSTSPISSNTPTPPLNPSSKYKAFISPSVKKNLDEIEKACIKYGLTDRFLIIALKSNILKETLGVPKNENLEYGNTKISRLKKYFGKRVASLVAGLADDTTLKKAGKWPGEVGFGDYIYGNLSGEKGINFENTKAGDGYRYRGRGYIQITGKNQYEEYGNLLNQDFINNPDSLNTPQNAAETTVLYIRNRIPELTTYYGKYFGYTISKTNPVFKSQADANLFITNCVAGSGNKFTRPIKNTESPFVEILAKVDSYSTQVTTNV